MLEPDDDPLPQHCAVNLDSIESLSVAVLIQRLGRLADERVEQISAAVEAAVGCQDR